MRYFLANVAIACALLQSFGCSTKSEKPSTAPVETPAEGEETGEEEVPAPAADAETFGDPIDPSTPVVSLADVLANPEAYKDKTIITEGTVRQVCQKRGCWAEIRPEDARDSATMRVTFKGYAFFLPKDSRGANVRIEGKVSVMLLKPEEVAHLEEEGATIPNKKEDGSALATEFIAAGVEMTGRKK